MLKNKINKLTQLRKEINNIDKVFFKLFKKRSFIIPKVIKIKETWNYKIAFNREVSMAKKIATQDFGLYNSLFLQKIWRELISATLFIEANLRVLIYKNPKNYFDLWEITKDHFSGAANIEINEDIHFIFNELVNQKTECIILPNFIDTEEKWWIFLLKEKYQDIKINMKLPFIEGIKTLGTSKGFILSLNNKDISNDNLLYIIEKPLAKLVEKIDETSTHILIKSKLSLSELVNQLKIPKSKIKFIGSYANPIR